MGLDFNYLLYFPKDRLWDVLKNLAKFSDTFGGPETTIIFPDHELKLPFVGSFTSNDPVYFDDPEFDFALSLLFEEDSEILDYMINLGNDQSFRSPPDDPDMRSWPIGYIYLTVFADITSHWAFEKPADIVLFKFGTTGTKMSMLFHYSTSIREKFCTLLEDTGGLYGIFDQEVDYGELFWYRGKRMDITVIDNYMLPNDLDQFLRKQN